MCVKNVYHNIYSDGRRDVTEHVDTCRPGHLCTSPTLMEFNRRHAYPRPSSSSRSPSRQASSPRYEQRSLFPPSPVSGYNSGSERESDRERRRAKRHSSVYVDSEQVANVGSRRRDSRRGQRPIIDAQIPYAPVPPSPISIPRLVTQEPTFTSQEANYSGSDSGRRSRPVIIDGSRRASTSPVFGLDLPTYTHTSRHSPRADAFLNIPRSFGTTSPHSPTLSSHSLDTPEERADRRRRRRAARDMDNALRVAEKATSHSMSPSSPYASSFESAASSSTAAQWTTLPKASRTTTAKPSPAVKEVKKHLRFTDSDPARAAQNAKIQARPKLTRAATATEEVKGILKNNNGGDAAVAAATATVRAKEMEDLMKSVNGLGIAERSSSSSSRWTRKDEDRGDLEYQDRLRQRFSTPARRMEKSELGGRRVEVSYPDQGRYRMF